MTALILQDHLADLPGYRSLMAWQVMIKMPWVRAYLHWAPRIHRPTLLTVATGDKRQPVACVTYQNKLSAFAQMQDGPVQRWLGRTVDFRWTFALPRRCTTSSTTIR